MHYKPLRLLISALLLGVALPAAAGGAESAFLSARDAFRNGERVRLARAVDALKDHPLRPWAEYWLLRLRLEEGATEDIPAYLTTYADSYPADRLRADWLKYLGKRSDFAGFSRELPALVQGDSEISCYAQQAAHMPEAVRPLWLSGQDLPQSCVILVDQLVAAGGLSAEDVWTRVRRLFEAKRVGAARDAAGYLPKSEGFDGKGLETIVLSPARYLDKLPAAYDTKRGGREMVLFAVQRLARSDAADAATRFARIEQRFPAEERAYAWGQIAWAAAMQHRPEAGAWYDKAVGTPWLEEQTAWAVRAALRAGDWTAVERLITAMPPAQAAQADWSYWLGRALVAQGRRDDARALFQRIAGQPNFYGTLANDEIGRPTVTPPKASPPSREELAAAAAHPGLQRAQALIRADMRTEGVREWAFSLRGMDDRQLLAAADLARRAELWDRAINTADKTQLQHDYSLRYLAPFRAQVEPRAKELSLDNGWVYGLMRQESRFITNAKSSVGAKGLMQLMPATAKWVAKKIRLVDFHPGKVAETDTNVTLGTNYLKMVLDSLDNHPVLASAAYNAGPGRARRWRAERPLEGAIYAETIPFTETRDYVKKVMCNAVYYNALFDDRPQSLKTLLGVIRARGQSDAAAELLP